MTLVTVGGARAHAEALAAQITVPVYLPLRLDNTRLDRLSVSSLTKFLKCPEEWRRHYLCRERFPSSPAMALGSFVDDTVGYLYREIIAGRPHPPVADLLDVYAEQRAKYLERQEVAWTSDEPAGLIERLGREAVELFVAQLAPAITEPIAVQREITFRLSPHAHWIVTGFIDVEERTRVRDTKVKKDSIYGKDIEGDLQPSTYLLARYLEGNPADAFWWDIVLKPGKKRKSMSVAQVEARRTVAQLRATLVRYAAAARRMVALYEQFGPDNPWDFADPKHNLCSARFCGFHGSCPGGGGLGDTPIAVLEAVTEARPVPVEQPAPAPAPDPVQLPAPPDTAGVLVGRLPAAAAR